MSRNLPWNERLNTFQINPESARAKDISEMARELSELIYLSKNLTSLINKGYFDGLKNPSHVKEHVRLCAALAKCEAEKEAG